MVAVLNRAAFFFIIFIMIEPFKIKTVEPIVFLSEKERRQILKKAGYNLFNIPSDKVTIDLLTDSGTGAMGEDQWAMMMRADEAYAGARSWQRFQKSVREFTGKREVIPVHQGRAAEKLLADLLVKNKGDCAVSNTFFDTTRGNFEHAGAVCYDLPSTDNLSSWQKFKGNIDLKKLENFFRKNHLRTRALVMTLTNNAGGGQPVSLANLKAARKISRAHKILLIVDGCRMVENAYFVKKLEKPFSKLTVAQIVKKLLAESDVMFMSAKKDGLANMGGFIATNNKSLADEIRKLGILYEGYLTYGGMSGRDMESVAQGLKEVVDENYLDYRIGQVAYLHKKLSEIGFSLINPPGGHAVYIDAARALPHIKKAGFPGQALAAAFYSEGGVRTVEIGSLMFGKAARHELVRLAIPRRVYTRSHLDYVAETAKAVWKNRKSLRGLRIVRAPKEMRHFSAILAPL